MALVLTGVKVHLPHGEARYFPAKDVRGLDLGVASPSAPNAHPSILAVVIEGRSGTKVHRFVGFPLEIIDEERMIEVPAPPAP